MAYHQLGTKILPKPMMVLIIQQTNMKNAAYSFIIYQIN